MRQHRTSIVLVCSLALPAAIAPGAAAQHSTTATGPRAVVWGGSSSALAAPGTEEDPTLVRERFVGSRTDRILWDGEGPVLDVQVSPTGEHVAFREKIWREDVDPAEASYVSESVTPDGSRREHRLYENEVLWVVDRVGHPVRRVERVRRFTWSPDGAAVAYVVGDYYEGGVGFADPETFVLDVASGRTREIADGGVDLHWAAHDGALYVERLGAPVLRYDPRTDAVEATELAGIHFSPDGSLYYAATREGLPFRLFRTTDHHEITGDSGFLRSFAHGIVDARGWVAERTLAIASSLPGPPTDFVYRVGDEEARRVEGRVQGLVDGGESVLVAREGELTVRPLAALERVRAAVPTRAVAP